MNIELVNTGTELLLGRVLNTHQQWLCRELADRGYVVSRQVAVSDSADAIEGAVREALIRADLVITTGGLGPTSDDLTRDRIAGLLGRRCVSDPIVAAAIQGFFASRKRPMPSKVLTQALVPEGARVLANAHGTAPGLALHLDPNPFRPGSAPSWLVMLPGPPRELRPMFTQQVAPLLASELPLSDAFVCRTLRTTGIGESALEDQLESPLQPLLTDGLELGFCARTGEVDVRLVARGPQGLALVQQAAEIVRRTAGKHVYAEGDDDLETTLVRRLALHRKTLAIAESCTGGYIANRITNVPGASAVLLAAWVTYSNSAKQHCLGVSLETLAAHGAVSDEVARQMAQGARRESGADYALAVTGIAGPGGGSDDKPVGTVFIALATTQHTHVLHPVNRYDRPTFKFVTSQQALDLLRRALPDPNAPNS